MRGVSAGHGRRRRSTARRLLRLLRLQRQDDAEHGGLLDLGGAGRVAEDELRGRAVDPGHEHRPVEGELAGQVEVVERDARRPRLAGRGRLAVVEHQGEQQVGAVDLRSAASHGWSGTVVAVPSTCR